MVKYWRFVSSAAASSSTLWWSSLHCNGITDMHVKQNHRLEMRLCAILEHFDKFDYHAPSEKQRQRKQHEIK